MTIKGVRKPKSKSPKQLDAEIDAALGSGNGWGPVSTPDIPPFTGASVDVDGSTIKIVPAAVRATRSPHDAWFARAVKRTNDDAWLVVSPRGHGCRALPKIDAALSPRTSTQRECVIPFAT